MKYLLATIKHKWFVLLASFKTGLPLWLAITHDLSKFSRAELPHYNRQFFGDKGDPEGFALAWLHHQNGNDHHWQWWITRSNKPPPNAVDGCLPMSDSAVLHMITDWLGAQKAYQGNWDISEWVGKNLWNMKMHPETLDRVLFELGRLGLYKEDEGALFTLRCYGLIEK